MYKVKKRKENPDKIKYLTIKNLYTFLQIFHSYKNMCKYLLSMYICGEALYVYIFFNLSGYVLWKHTICAL